MKRVPPKAKKKSKTKKSSAIRRLRGKYKHLDLMNELAKSRKEDRQRDRARATKSKRSVVRESAPVYGATQRDLFETESRNGERLGYSPAYSQPAFTNFRGVTPKTNLAALNLNWREADLPEKQRTKHVHRLHPYLGKFIPQLVEIFLRKFRPKSVYDPFAGSGTTLVEAKTLGIDAIGCDVSEFNCLLMKVKTDVYDVRKLEREIRDALHRLNVGLRTSLFGEKAAEIQTDNPYLNRWFHAKALAELLSFRELIGDYEYGDPLKIILSRAARSARLTTHFDLDF